jgi:hypothetical protein
VHAWPADMVEAIRDQWVMVLAVVAVAVFILWRLRGR